MDSKLAKNGRQYLPFVQNVLQREKNLTVHWVVRHTIMSHKYFHEFLYYGELLQIDSSIIKNKQNISYTSRN